MMRTGLAFCALPEVKRILSGEQTQLVFTRQELARATGAGGLLHLAGVLAAKKAFLKAAGQPDFQPVSLIATRILSSGCPVLTVRSRFLRNLLTGSSISLSISHTREVAVAFCLLYADKPGDRCQKKALGKRKQPSSLAKASA
ncbi:MAG TPA: hypothetical protein PKX93_00610 [bacterium]|nr:hypothetical protein [bacterium]